MKILKTSLLFFFISVLSYAQVPDTEDMDQEIPIDPNVKIGKLDNGITYYIRSNPKSEERAELRLVINAGSVLEEESQLGLAHFLEHMAFNGTRNFDKNELIDYLQDLGVEFGADLNAHTGFEETVYKLTLPTDDETFDTGLMILRDWADGIELSGEEIDNERGVVAEELRSGLTAGRRVMNQYYPVLTNNSRHSQRLPIGKMDVIMNSDHEEIRSFYRDWYRPDLMALVIVGDIDVEEVEDKIVNSFQSVEPAENPRERVKYGIPEATEPAAMVITDKELTGVNFRIYFPRQRKKVEDQGDYRESLVRRMYSGMLNERLRAKVEAGDAPFLGGSVGLGRMLADKNSYYTGAALAEDKIEEGIESLLEESERAKRYGFGEGELERYKKILLNSADLSRKEEGKKGSRYYVEQYIDHYMDDDPIPSSDYVYQFYQTQLAGISLEEVNAVGKEWFNTGPFTALLQAPEKEGLELPSEEEILNVVEAVSDKEVAPYEDDFVDRPLMTEMPEAGEIVSSSYDEEVNITTLKLSNNTTVLLKPTTFQNDIINLYGFRDGGSSLAPDEDYISVRSSSNLVNASGLNGLSGTELRRVNSGKSVSVTPYVNFYEELVSASSATKDFETMLQMAHLYFTSPNKDEDVFKTMKERLVENAKNPESNPGRYFSQEISKVMAQGHPRGVNISSEEYEEELDLDVAYDFYKERMSDAGGFNFLLIGNFEVEEVKPLLEKYLASLPATQKSSTWRDIGLRRPEGKIQKVYYKGSEDKSEVVIRFTGNLDFDLQEKELISSLGKVLRLKLYEEMREEKGEVYGVRVSGFASDKPSQWYRVAMEFTSDPENAEGLIQTIYDEIRNIQENGVSEKDLNKVKEAMLLNAEQGQNYNGYWIVRLKEAVEYDLDPTEIPNYKEKIEENITAENLQRAAQKYLNFDNVAEFILYPEDYKNQS